MPELPEVESIRLQLNRFLVDHKILKVIVNYRKTLERDEEKLIGGIIVGVRRFGKVLSIDLDNGYSALMHVKMTGQPIYRGPNLENPSELSRKVIGGIPGKHTHVIFNLDKGGVLYFNDYRKFGWIKIIETNNVNKNKFVGKLGPEPLKDLTESLFKSILKKSNKPIKTLLMDQTKIAGIGNIYANDALYLAEINPKKSSSMINQIEQIKLYNSINNILKEGINRGGSSERSYVTPDGSEGNYQNFTLVYGKEGKRCKKCGAVIKKARLGGRGTYFCPTCQK